MLVAPDGAAALLSVRHSRQLDLLMGLALQTLPRLSALNYFEQLPQHSLLKRFPQSLRRQDTPGLCSPQRP